MANPQRPEPGLTAERLQELWRFFDSRSRAFPNAVTVDVRRDIASALSELEQSRKRIAALKAWLENEIAVADRFGEGTSDLRTRIEALKQERPWIHGVQAANWSADTLRAVLATLQEPR